MAWLPISLTVPQYVDSNGDPASGFVLKAYEAGTSTNTPFSTDSTGGTQATSIALNSDGYPEVSGNIVIPHIDQSYKLSLYPTQAAADSDSGATWSIDNLTPVSNIGFANDVNSQTVTYSLQGSDEGKLIMFTGAGGVELDLLAVADSGEGFTFLVENNTSSTVTIDPDGSEQINDAASLVLQDGESAIVVCTGSAWRAFVIIASRNPFGFPINLQIVPSVGSNALTVAFKGKDGNDPSAFNEVIFDTRSSTASSGAYAERSLTSAASVVAPSGATLGHNDGEKDFIYVYAIDNSGTIEPAISSKFFGWHGIGSTTAIDTSADSGTVMYSTSARSNVPFACVGMLEVTETTAGTWATAPSDVRLAPFSHPVVSFSAHKNGTAQTGVADATFTLVTFSTERFDNGSRFASSRWTPPPGSAKLYGIIQFAASLSDQQTIICAIYKNGSSYREFRLQTSGTAAQSAAVSVEDECNGTDYYELFAYQSGGGGAKVIAGESYLTTFEGIWSPARE